MKNYPVDLYEAPKAPPRHIVEVSPEGSLQIRDHNHNQMGTNLPFLCERIEAALVAFTEQVRYAGDTDPLLPAREPGSAWYCSVGADGNFEIGGAVNE